MHEAERLAVVAGELVERTEPGARIEDDAQRERLGPRGGSFDQPRISSLSDAPST